MEKYTYNAAITKAVQLEYTRSAPEALRLKIRALMHLPLVKPWQFAGSIFLLLASPLSLYFFGPKLIYSSGMLLIVNIAAGSIAFLIIFAGVAHRYSDPKNKADFLNKFESFRAKIS
ncbi:MAG: hypothetical protein LDLANPLL_02497 [Turneriella sp.]|nr:hypothetical protein [Turneriella sp.]